MGNPVPRSTCLCDKAVEGEGHALRHAPHGLHDDEVAVRQVGGAVHSETQQVTMHSDILRLQNPK